MYIPVPNRFVSEDEKLICGDELYLFYFLSMHELRFFSGKIVVSVSALAKEVVLKKSVWQNKEYINSLLCLLRDKKIVEFEDVVSNRKDKNSYDVPCVIYSCVADFMSQGYEKIDFSLFRMVDKLPIKYRGSGFYVLCYIQKNKSSRGISVVEWAQCLGCSERTVRSLLSLMEQSGLIVKNSGGYFLSESGIRQEKNKYLLNREGLRSTVFGELTEEEIKDYIDDSVWGKRDESGRLERIDQESYFVFRLCKDLGLEDVFVRKCERVIAKIKDMGNYDGLFEEFEEGYVKEKKDLGIY